MEAWIAGLLTSANAPEECLKRQINAHRDILHHLRLHPGQRRPFDFERGQGGGLVVVAQRFLPLFPRIASFRQQVVEQPAAFFQLLFEESLLLLAGRETILKRFQHAYNVRVIAVNCQAHARYRLKATRLSSLCLKA
jgi:hypothetical protein